MCTQIETFRFDFLRQKEVAYTHTNSKTKSIKKTHLTLAMCRLSRVRLFDLDAKTVPQLVSSPGDIFVVKTGV